MNTKHGILLVSISLLLFLAFVGTASVKIISGDDNSDANFTVTGNQTQTLASAINNGNGGWFDLNPNVTYTGGVTISYDTGIRGHGATIDLMGGYIWVEKCILEIDNCRIKNGSSGGGHKALHYNNADGNISNCNIIHYGISCTYSDPFIANNTIKACGDGIYLRYSDPIIVNNIISSYVDHVGAGIYCYESNPMVTKNSLLNNENAIHCEYSNPSIKYNIISNNSNGILCYHYSNPNITNNNLTTNTNGIKCFSSEPSIYYNNIYSNTAFGVRNDDFSVIINATLNWWGNITGPTHFDNPNGTGDTVTDYVDYEPWLLSPVTLISTTFDTGSGTYPSIFGTHNGTIKPNHDVIVNRMYTYPCPGTGGHTDYVRFENESWNITENWKGYQGDWYNITFDESFTLEAGETYNYTIRTGSYPQIHHNRTLTVPDGEIICTEFIDANGKKYNDWIPAIKLE